MMMKRIAVAAALTAALFASGCGEDDGQEGNDGQESNQGVAVTAKETGATSASDGTTSSEKTATAETVLASTRRGRVIKAIDSEYGTVIADGKGEAFYLFDKEKTAKSQCFGTCAQAWPPVLTRGKPRAGKGVRAKLLGTTRRPNGKLQVTYAGHPLYHYVADSPGTILCQNVSEFGGLWLVVEPSGNPVL